MKEEGGAQREAGRSVAPSHSPRGGAPAARRHVELGGRPSRRIRARAGREGWSAAPCDTAPLPPTPSTLAPQYYPPDHDPTKGSLNAQQGTHALRARAARLKSEGVLVVRFEMPFPVWCGGCGHLMGKGEGEREREGVERVVERPALRRRSRPLPVPPGVRFNADKSAAGKYHTTPVWRFAMVTPCCQHRVVIRTDPQSSDFVVESGGRRKTVRDAGMDPDADTGERTVLPDRRAAAAARADPFSALELAAADAARAAASREAVDAAVASSAKYGDDWAANRAARAGVRPARRAADAARARGEAIGLPASIVLAPETSADRMLAAAVVSTRDRSAAARRAGRAAATVAPLFGGGIAKTTTTLPPGLVAAARRRRAAAAAAAGSGGVVSVRRPQA